MTLTYLSLALVKDFQTLQQTPNRPLFNRALRGLYPLASTIKPFIALEGLDTGVTTADFTLYDPGWYQMNKNSHRFHDWKKGGHGRVDLNNAILLSCDTYFFDLSNKLGINRIDNILNRFGFGTPTGIDLDDELGGVVASPEWNVAQKASHGTKVTRSSLGLDKGLCKPRRYNSQLPPRLANRGRHFIPYLLLTDQAPLAVDPVTLQSPANWEIVINAMQNVVAAARGTGKSFGRNLPYTIAAKSGTAQVYSMKWTSNDETADQTHLPEKLRSHSLFIAFAPVENPKLAMAVVVENTSTAVNIAITRRIFDAYFADTPQVPS